MTLLMTSRSVLPAEPSHRAKLVARLVTLHNEGHQVVFVSNKAERSWFDDEFADTGVKFIRFIGRQRAESMAQVVAKVGVPAHEILVLAGSNDDVRMAKNGGLALLGAGWAADQVVGRLGLKVDDPKALEMVVDLLSKWRSAGWFYSADAPGYGVRALSSLSSNDYTSNAQRQFGKRITHIVKQGGGGLPALLAITARSMETGGLGSALGGDALFCTFPSSNSANDDTETLSDFTHRLRTTLSRVRFAERGKPLFVRHLQSKKRSKAPGIDRMDPTEQLLTLHVNPYYRDKGRIVDRHVVVIDDCLTYGVSFGVAAALLRRAGAAHVTCVALGKFGNQARGYDIEITGDPFAPLSAEDLGRLDPVAVNAASSSGIQESLIDLLG